MKEIPIKKHIIYIFGLAMLVFVLNKFYLRPWVLENQTPDIFLTFTYSVPNLIEAIIGTLIITGILLQLRQYFNKKIGSIQNLSIYLLAVTIAAIYVISQEFKFHHLGGNNVYDPNDVIASLIGLIVAFGIIQGLGFAEETKNAKE